MKKIDVNQELKKIENALRDIISFALNVKYGSAWIIKLKVDEEKKNSWKEKMNEEEKKYKGEVLDNRLLYYSEFHDLYNIINKHWDDVFCEVFQEKKQIEVLLDIISSYRISIAHNRHLKDYQKYFLAGASGIIRHLIKQYKSDKDKEDSYYPTLQSIIIDGLDITKTLDSIKLYEKRYHVGDEIDVIVNVNCPPDINVKYAIAISNSSYHFFFNKDYKTSNKKKIKIKKKYIPRAKVHIVVKSDQKYHREKDVDIRETHGIIILPNKWVTSFLKNNN